jgi:hypothetical protein
MSSFTTVSTAYQLEPQRLLTQLKNSKILKEHKIRRGISKQGFKDTAKLETGTI